MIRDIQQSNSIPVSDSLSVQSSQEIEIIFKFIDFSISKFYDYYLEYGDSEMEDRISDLLVSCFNEQLVLFKNGFLSVIFKNKPTEAGSTRQPDIGVEPKQIKKPFKPIIVLEAKRLYDSSHSHEYVYGNTGGIERFKRCLHAVDDNICGMIGYIQVQDSNYWFAKVNDWIGGLAEENTDETIDWTCENEKLIPVNSFMNGQKYSSLNHRKPKDDFIRILHYFVKLT
ncbi:MAG: hypothetical protein LBR10_07075 [Prevotellaceae bacterium]|jgi:hypothetical protein|nr:hypothetical protein [Prevotellaceae bacterium]